jgi:hypothetical protein
VLSFNFGSSFPLSCRQKSKMQMYNLFFKAISSFLLLIILLSVSSSSISAACTLADRNNASAIPGGLPSCVKVGFLSPTPNGPNSTLTETQKYWAITLPQRVWKNVKQSLAIRGVTIEEIQTNIGWGDAITSTENGTYDIFVANFWMLASRAQRVDFLIPYLREDWMLLYRTPPAENNNPVVNWADPFTFQVWATFVCIIIAGGIFLWIAELINHGWNGDHHQHILRPDEELHEDPFMMLREFDIGNYLEAGRNALSHSFGTIFGTYDVVPRSFGGWLVSWALHWFVFVFFASYTANLATFLSLRKTSPPRTTNELFARPMITVPELEIQNMIREQTLYKSVKTFGSNVLGYGEAFLASGADSAALPELDVKEIILNDCSLSATSTDLSVESSFIFRQQDSIYAAKQVIDQAMLQFADFGILARWVDSGLPTDKCDRSTDLANAGAMSLDELGGAFVVALVLFAIATAVAVWTWVNERFMMQRVIEKYGENGPHRSDDIHLVGDFVGECQTAVDDTKRAAAALVELLSERTSEDPTNTKMEKSAMKRSSMIKNSTTIKKADWQSSNVQILSLSNVSSEMHKSLLMFLDDGIVTVSKKDKEDDELSSDDEERERDRQIKRTNDTNSIAHQIPKEEREAKTQLSAKHLAKIRGAVVAAASALRLAEDSINRSGRRRYCNLPIESCNSRVGNKNPKDISEFHDFEQREDESPEAFQERMTRERLHMQQLLEVARGATKSAKATVDAAEIALLSSMMQRGRRRYVLEKWMNRAFRATAFLTLLIASAARRVANESSYTSKTYLEREHEALDELSELAALTANEVEAIIRSLREDEATALSSPPQVAKRRDFNVPNNRNYRTTPTPSSPTPPIVYENRYRHDQEMQQQQQHLPGQPVMMMSPNHHGGGQLVMYNNTRYVTPTNRTNNNSEPKSGGSRFNLTPMKMSDY